MQYAVETWGDGAERIVMVHGSLGVGASAFSEQKVLESRYTVQVMTRRGYGTTPPIAAVDIQQDARDVVELLGEGAHLVGTSMGGIVSLNAAGLRPDLVRSLTVIEPPAFPIAADLPDVRRVSGALKRHWAKADPSDLRSFVVGFLDALEFRMPMPDPLPGPVAAAAVNLVTERPWRVDVPVGAVAESPFPKMVVTGGHSPAFDAIAGRLAQLLDCQLHTLTGAGHAVQKVGAPFNERLENLISAACGSEERIEDAD